MVTTHKTCSIGRDERLIWRWHHALLCYRRCTWLRIDSSGGQTTVKADKRNLNHILDLAIPIRDMRLLDSGHATSHRGSIAVREGAIVFAIEYAVLRISLNSSDRRAGVQVVQLVAATTNTNGS